MERRKHFLDEATTDGVERVLASGRSVVVLVGVGSVEPHGPHLSLMTDTIISKAVALRVADVLGDRSAQSPVLGDGDVGEALGPALLGPLLPCVELPARLVGATRHHHSAHMLGLEHAERRAGEVLLRHGTQQQGYVMRVHYVVYPNGYSAPTHRPSCPRPAFSPARPPMR